MFLDRADGDGDQGRAGWFYTGDGESASEMMTEPEFVRGAPYNTPIRRLDDVKAARDLDLAWHGQPREVSSAAGS